MALTCSRRRRLEPTSVAAMLLAAASATADEALNWMPRATCDAGHGDGGVRLVPRSELRRSAVWPVRRLAVGGRFSSWWSVRVARCAHLPDLLLQRRQVNGAVARRASIWVGALDNLRRHEVRCMTAVPSVQPWACRHLARNT
jgi:hypothetical protein